MWATKFSEKKNYTSQEPQFCPCYITPKAAGCQAQLDTPTALGGTIILGLEAGVLILVIQHAAPRALYAGNFVCSLPQVSPVPLACPCPTEGSSSLKELFSS